LLERFFFSFLRVRIFQLFCYVVEIVPAINGREKEKRKKKKKEKEEEKR